VFTGEKMYRKPSIKIDHIVSSRRRLPPQITLFGGEKRGPSSSEQTGIAEKGGCPPRVAEKEEGDSCWRLLHERRQGKVQGTEPIKREKEKGRVKRGSE